MFQTPKRFQLAGQTVYVSDNPRLLSEHGCLGRADYDGSRIEIQADTDSVHVPLKKRDQIFLHELTHMILDTMGETEQSEDERFVECFSNLLHQALDSKQ